MRAAFVFRVRIVLIGFGIIAAFLCARLYIVQAIDGDVFAQAATDQYVTVTAAVENRGNILFRALDGREPHAATMDGGYRIVVEAGVIKDPEAVYERIQTVTEAVAREHFLSAASAEDDKHRDVAHRVAEEEALGVRDLEIDGIAVGRERWRSYPAGELAAHVIGFVGFSGNEKSGRYGLERYWEETLRRDDSSLYVNFFAEIFSNVHAFVSAERKGKSEGDVVTTIEPVVQQNLESALESIKEMYRGREVGGMVMDPRTGEIVAMAARPVFDPNDFSSAEDISVYTNPLVERVYEFGSIFKPLTMAAGIDVGAISPQTTYYDAGYVEKSGFTIRNYDGEGRGRVDIQEVLNQSLNTGAVFMVDQMGGKTFTEYMHAFGIGETTGIDLPNEVVGLTDALESGVAVDYASASFGQGIAITPIAMTRALSVLANGGELVVPHVTSEIRYRSGLRSTPDVGEPVQVLSSESAETVTRMLVKVVDDALLGGSVKMEHYSIAAKTGTAQIALPGGKGYYDDRYLHSFFGYFPAYDAQFIIFLYVVEPQGVRYASQTLTAPFMNMVRFLINYYDIPPDR